MILLEKSLWKFNNSLYNFKLWICRRDEKSYLWGSTYAWQRQNKWQAIQMEVLKVLDLTIYDSAFKKSYQRRKYR